jgi:hypothetical protein
MNTCVYCGEAAYHKWNFYKGLCESCHTAVLLDRAGVHQWDAKQCLSFLKIFNAGRHNEEMTLGYYEIVRAAAFLIAIGKEMSLCSFEKEVDNIHGSLFGLMTKDVDYKEKLVFDYKTPPDKIHSYVKREMERITEKNQEAEAIVDRMGKAKDIYDKSAAFERQLKKLERLKEKQEEDEQLVAAQISITMQSTKNKHRPA